MPLSHSLDFEGHQILRKLNSEFQQPNSVGQTCWKFLEVLDGNFPKIFARVGK